MLSPRSARAEAKTRGGDRHGAEREKDTRERERERERERDVCGWITCKQTLSYDTIRTVSY